MTEEKWKFPLGLKCPQCGGEWEPFFPVREDDKRLVFFCFACKVLGGYAEA